MLCSKCKVNESTSSHTYCPSCKRDYDKNWYSKNSEGRCKDMRARHRADPRIHMLSAAKRRAKQKGIEFSITKDNIVIPELCPILGVRIEVNDRRWQDSSPTIDRIDATVGYITGNVHVICARANRIKNDATVDELELIASYLRKSGLK